MFPLFQLSMCLLGNEHISNNVLGIPRRLLINGRVLDQYMMHSFRITNVNLMALVKKIASR